MLINTFEATIAIVDEQESKRSWNAGVIILFNNNDNRH